MDIIVKKIVLLFDILFHLLPVDKRKVLFMSFKGQYNDNPKYISEKLHEIHPEIRIYWVIANKSYTKRIPNYVNVVQPNTLKYLYIKNRCKIVVENSAGMYLVNSSKQMMRFIKLLKNRKQIDVATWHGNPIKHIGAQIPGNEKWCEDTFFSTADMLIAGCEQIQQVFNQAFLHKIPIEMIGTPRTDILFNNAVEKNEIRRHLNLPADKKIILYAPTYRNTPFDSGIAQMQCIRFNELFKALNKKFGGDWVFVFRLHNVVQNSIDINSISIDSNGCFINGNQFDDMNEYLIASDVLLTDYSGCIYDVALTDIPCFLFAHDREHYVEKERGMYMNLDSFPYPFADTFDQLIININNYNEEESKVRIHDFLKKIGNIEDGNAALRMVCYLERYM